MRGRCEEGMDDSDDDEDIPLLVGADDVEDSEQGNGGTNQTASCIRL